MRVVISFDFPSTWEEFREIYKKMEKIIEQFQPKDIIIDYCEGEITFCLEEKEEER